ncbi:hypothetical protein [Streptomyces yanii]|uniref:hypothetical protein n=1 Tax=Streptomyces yanii TaxID=78510 RepID=UPI0031E8C8D8
MAIGALWFNQALLQIPMGMLSIALGRRPVIIGWLDCLYCGSLVVQLCRKPLIGSLSIGRAMQGMVQSRQPFWRFAADITRDSQRPKVIAMIGMLSAFPSLCTGSWALLGQYIGYPDYSCFTELPP